MSVKYGGRLGAILEKYPRVHCPICATPQVQIINYNKGDPKWKCRKCKQQFTMPFNDHGKQYEPIIELNSTSLLDDFKTAYNRLQEV